MAGDIIFQKAGNTKPKILHLYLMLTKINRRDCLDKYPNFPSRIYDDKKDEEALFYPKIIKSYILTLPSKTFKGHVSTLAAELTRLTKAVHADTLIFLGDTETSWLYQDNDYKPAKDALDYLKDKNIGKRFNGALQVDTTELPVFIRHIAWLTRCNAALPYFYFIDEQKNILGNICKYGNLHLDTLHEQANHHLTRFMQTSKFAYGDNNSCHNWFGKTSAISGRQINLR